MYLYMYKTLSQNANITFILYKLLFEHLMEIIVESYGVVRNIMPLYTVNLSRVQAYCKTYHIIRISTFVQSTCLIQVIPVFLSSFACLILYSLSPWAGSRFHHHYQMLNSSISTGTHQCCPCVITPSSCLPPQPKPLATTNLFSVLTFLSFQKVIKWNNILMWPFWNWLIPRRVIKLFHVPIDSSVLFIAELYSTV